MKIKSIVNCNGVGYENFKIDEIRDIEEDLAKILIEFNYAEEVKGEE